MGELAGAASAGMPLLDGGECASYTQPTLNPAAPDPGRTVAAVRCSRLFYTASRLRLRLRDCPHVTIHSADCLRFPLPVGPYTVFANIPFNRTSAIIGRPTAEGCAPLDSYLAMQRAAAWRFLDSPRATSPSALLHPWFDATVCHQCKRRDFHPAPQVESVLLRLRNLDYAPRAPRHRASGAHRRPCPHGEPFYGAGNALVAAL